MPPAPDLLADLTRRGFTFRVLLGGLSVTPASALTAEDREAIRERRDELLAALSPAEPWDSRVAVKLMCDADAMVERSGVNGNHLAVKDTAAMVASAFATRDLEMLRFACAEFAVVVRGLASAHISANKTGQSTAKTAMQVLPSCRTVPRTDSSGTDCGRET